MLYHLAFCICRVLRAASTLEHITTKRQAKGEGMLNIFSPMSDGTAPLQSQLLLKSTSKTHMTTCKQNTGGDSLSWSHETDIYRKDCIFNVLSVRDTKLYITMMEMAWRTESYKSMNLIKRHFQYIHIEWPLCMIILSLLKWTIDQSLWNQTYVSYLCLSQKYLQSWLYSLISQTGSA